MPRKAKTVAQLDREIAEKLTQKSIVVAWTTEAREIAPGQKAWRHDLGERPRWVEVTKPEAAMWVRAGGLDDLRKATTWVTRDYPQTGRVYAYPTTEKDPLGRARRDVLEQKPSSVG